MKVGSFVLSNQKMTKGWFGKARQDLRVANAVFALELPPLEACAFHCQQCVEKSIKGFLTFHGVKFKKTHDLVELGKQALKIDPELASILQRLEDLNRYAVAYRYGPLQ